MKQRTITVGLTGDVGTGKSTVLSWLERHGAAVLDADRVVHDLLSADVGIVDAITCRFGEGVRDASGGIDRSALASVVFDGGPALSALESLVHPAVAVEVDRWLAEVDAAVAVVEAVKLVESGLAERFDHVWLVVCEPVVRKTRLVERGWSPEEAERRMNAGAPLVPRMAAADVVIDNSGHLEDTVRQLERAFAALVAGTEGEEQA